MRKQSSEYKSLKEWSKSKPKDYKSAKEKGALRDIAEHFGWSINRPRGYWTKERVLEESKKYNSITDWKTKSNASLRAAQKLGIYEEASKHISRKTHKPVNVKPRGYWTKDNILKDSSKYIKISEWKKSSSSAERASRRLGIYQIATKHMRGT